MRFKENQVEVTIVSCSKAVWNIGLLGDTEQITCSPKMLKSWIMDFHTTTNFSGWLSATRLVSTTQIGVNTLQFINLKTKPSINDGRRLFW